MTLMDTPPATTMVSLTVEGAQANLTLARPDKFNAMNVEMIQELIALLEWTAERSAGRQDSLHDENGTPFLRTLVLREGKHFCAGADINMMRDAGANTPEENRADSKRSTGCSTASGRTPASRLVPFRCGLGRRSGSGVMLRLRGGHRRRSHRAVRG